MTDKLYNIITGVAFVIGLFGWVTLGYQVGVNQIVKDCRLIGQFHIDNKVYDCEPYEPKVMRK